MAATGAEVIPPYAFDGAYATYTLNDYYNRQVTYTISDVNITAQTFKVSWSYTGTWNSTGSASTQSISYATLTPLPVESANIPFSAANTADLQTLSRGKTPTDMPQDTVVTANVSIFARGGAYFNTDEVALPSGYTVWVDTRSGLMVAEDFDANGAAWGVAYGQLSLISTNVPMTANVTSSASPTPPPPAFSISITVAAGVGLVAVVVVVGVLVYLRTHKRKAQA